MKRFTGQVETISPEALTVFDEHSHLRVIDWENRPEDVKLRYPENDNALLEFVTRAPVNPRTITNPIVRFVVDGSLANYTVLTQAITTSSTTIYLEDAAITAVGGVLIVVGTGEEMLVTAVDVSAGAATVTRAAFGGSALAAAIGAEIRPGAPVLGEVGEPKASHSTTPGDPSYNYITLTAAYFEMSVMQINAKMTAEWGTLDKMMADTQYQIETEVQNSLMFQHRYTGYDATEHQIYRGNGLIPQLSGNVLDLGNTGTNFLYESLNDFVNPMFASTLSANQKQVFCGHNLWADALTTSRQRGVIEQMDGKDINVDGKTGAKQFVMYTSDGNKLVFNRIGGMDGELANLGIVLDEANIGGSEYEGLGPQWFLNLQNPGQILKKKHAYLTSWEVHVYDRSTMGLIRGGTKPLIV